MIQAAMCFTNFYAIYGRVSCCCTRYCSAILDLQLPGAWWAGTAAEGPCPMPPNTSLCMYRHVFAAKLSTHEHIWWSGKTRSGLELGLARVQVIYGLLSPHLKFGQQFCVGAIYLATTLVFSWLTTQALRAARWCQAACMLLLHWKLQRTAKNTCIFIH
jgi:hypothetical protein